MNQSSFTKVGLSAFIILMCFGAMAANQYHTLVMEQVHHFTALEIGRTVMIGAATQIFLPWVVLYGSTKIPKPDLLLRASYLGLAVFLFLYPQATSKTGAMLTYWGATFSLNIASILQTTLILCVARPFGEAWVLALRSAGTLGYALSSLVCSLFSDKVGFPHLYILFSVAALIALIASFWNGDTITQQSSKISIPVVIKRITEPNTRLLILSVALANMAIFGGTAIIGNFIYNELHGTPHQVGIAWTIATLTEFPLVWLTIPIFRRYGLKTTLLTGVISSTLRMGLLWLCTDISFLYLIQIFHGLFFGTSLSTVGLYFARRYGQEHVHGLQLAGQSIYGGLASALGGQMAGLIWNQMGIRSVYAISFLMLSIALIFLFFFFKETSENATGKA